MRPEILFPLFAPVTSLKGVGARLQPLLTRLAGPIVRDVLFLKPHSLVRRTPATLSQAVDGDVMTFEVVVNDIQKGRGPQPLRIRVADPTGMMTLVFFGRYGDQIERRHPVGSRWIVS